MRAAWLAITVSVIITSCKEAPVAVEVPAATPELRVRARALYRQHCELCHGAKADGRGPRSEGLTKRPADFGSAAWRKSVTAAGVLDVIENGKPGSSMPAWRALSRDERLVLTAYVLSVSAEGP